MQRNILKKVYLQENKCYHFYKGFVWLKRNVRVKDILFWLNICLYL